jgi:hypothetical protein
MEQEARHAHTAETSSQSSSSAIHANNMSCMHQTSWPAKNSRAKEAQQHQYTTSSNHEQGMQAAANLLFALDNMQPSTISLSSHKIFLAF